MEAADAPILCACMFFQRGVLQDNGEFETVTSRHAVSSCPIPAHQREAAANHRPALRLIYGGGDQS